MRRTRGYACSSRSSVRMFCSDSRRVLLALPDAPCELPRLILRGTPAGVKAVRELEPWGAEVGGGAARDEKSRGRSFSSFSVIHTAINTIFTTKYMTKKMKQMSSNVTLRV